MSPPPSKTPPPRRGDDVPRDQFSEEEKTPVTNDPLLVLTHRARTTASNTRATLEVVNAVREDMKVAVKRDEEEHKRLGDSLSKLESRVEKIDEKLDGVSTTQAAHGAKLDAKLDAQDEKLDLILDLGKTRVKATIETSALIEQAQIADVTDAKKVRRSDVLDAKKSRRDRNLAILGILGSVLGAGGLAATIITLLATKC